MSDPRQNSKVSLEDLLRLKRAERPSPEFWAGFERELRQKQLTALVEKRRWWHDFSGVLGRRVSIYLPASAAAAVAITLVAVRYQAPIRVAQVENTALRIEAADPAVEMLPATVVASNASRFEEPIALEETTMRVENPAPAPVMASARRDEISPSARSIAANLEHLEQAEPELVNAVMGSRLSSTSRVQHAVASVEAEPSTNDSTPHYRLIARYAEHALSPQPAAPSLVRDRIARRLADDLGDGMSRIGVGGDRVSLKF